jgi:hypothetical protein
MMIPAINLGFLALSHGKIPDDKFALIVKATHTREPK